MAPRNNDTKIPTKQRQLVIKEFGTDFRRISQITEGDVPTPGPQELLVRNRYVGIQVAEVLQNKGFTLDGNLPPLPELTGHEAVGEVVARGGETTIKVGQPVVYMSFERGSNRDYHVVPEFLCFIVPDVDPVYLAFVGSGLSASLSYEKECDLQSGQTVLVTAAAGATGNFAVQLAKLKGCRVIGTCSTQEKVEYLKSIGCDRPVNYKKESLDEVLTAEYPKGLDVVYESCGKEMFDISMKHLAPFGRLLVIGSTSEYTHEGKDLPKSTLANPFQLLIKNASIRGFMAPQYLPDYQRHVDMLTKLYKEGNLQVKLNTYTGLESCVDALEDTIAGKTYGKSVVKLS